MAPAVCSLLTLLASWADATSVKIYDAQPTPVQVFRNSQSGETTFHVHLYVLVDAQDPTAVVQGGAFWRWQGTEAWLPAPAPLYDEHQVDPVEPGTTIRGYNIVWGESLHGLNEAPADAMEFRVWAMADGDETAVETTAAKPVEKVDISNEHGEQGKLDIFLFGAKAFQATADDGIHVHFVINVWPPQEPMGPNYQLFSQLQLGAQDMVRADAPSRFEHTYDVVISDDGKSKTCSRYNLSWRLPKALTMDACVENAEGTATVTAKSFDGAVGKLEFPLKVDCVAGRVTMV
jgi:hypothetical protein